MKKQKLSIAELAKQNGKVSKAAQSHVKGGTGTIVNTVVETVAGVAGPGWEEMFDY